VTISVAEQEKMLSVPLCGPRVLARLESIGISRLRDLAHPDAHDLVQEVNIQASRPIWHPPMATRAIANLIAAAQELDR
jgi:nucleotidyltransferase/DNA polymerase involved in DNA repair